MGSGFLPNTGDLHDGGNEISYQQNYHHQTAISRSHHPSFVERGGRIIRTNDHQQTIGETLVRPRSANPSFDNNNSIGIPPGFTSRQETPPHSNQSGAVIGSKIYFDDPYVDRSQILQLGQRRPASTGVIGDNQSSSSVLNSLGLGTGSSSKAVRPAAKTLMDLIQEDYPPENNTIDSRALYDSSTPIFQQSHLASRPLERPRTTSPLSSQHHMRGGYDYHDDRFGRGPGGIQRSMDLPGANLSDPMSRLTLGFSGETSYRANNEPVSIWRSHGFGWITGLSHLPVTVCSLFLFLHSSRRHNKQDPFRSMHQ